MFHPQGPSFLELMRQALSSTDTGYVLLAPKFDYTPFRTPEEVLDATSAALEARGPFARGLDVCCGTGAGVELLRRHCHTEVVGVDRVPAMLDQARRNLAPLGAAPGRAPVSLVVADALALPFEQEFDVVTCFGAFGHIEEKDEPRFVAEVFRALRPGGRFVFVTSEVPPVASKTWWLARGFNAAMRVRNALWRPPFIMYYLTFTLPGVVTTLERAGFEVSVEGPLLAPPRDLLQLVVATRPTGGRAAADR